MSINNNNTLELFIREKVLLKDFVSYFNYFKNNSNDILVEKKT